jgi:hypothetical protein
MIPVDTAHMLAIECLPGSDLTDKDQLLAMSEQARRYLLSHDWCRSVRRGFLDRGISGVLAVFYFEIEPDGADEEVWVIVGDIPPAYMDVESCPTGADALEAYLECMEEWVEAVRNGKSVDELIPVGYADTGRPIEPTPDAAEELAGRLAFIRNELVPWFREDRWERA